MAKREKEVHLYWPVGENEIQVESDDKKLNKEVLNLKETEPGAVYIIYDDDAPAFLRAAVKMQNISIKVHETKDVIVTEAQKTARSNNGKKAVKNKNLKNVKGECDD